MGEQVRTEPIRHDTHEDAKNSFMRSADSVTSEEVWLGVLVKPNDTGGLLVMRTTYHFPTSRLLEAVEELRSQLLQEVSLEPTRLPIAPRFRVEAGENKGGG